MKNIGIIDMLISRLHCIAVSFSWDWSSNWTFQYRPKKVYSDLKCTFERKYGMITNDWGEYNLNGESESSICSRKAILFVFVFENEGHSIKGPQLLSNCLSPPVWSNILMNIDNGMSSGSKSAALAVRNGRPGIRKLEYKLNPGFQPHIQISTGGSDLTFGRLL
jgi:hypothetical protein